MKKLTEFAIGKINEHRGRPRKDATATTGKVETFDGDKKTAEPISDEAIEDIDLNSPDNTESMEDLIDKFDAEEDFFIIGKAGWGKTTIIQKLAKKYNREVKVVYLDKAAKEDLGGIPIPVKGKDGAEQEMAMPAWAVDMKKNPDKDYLLFFDEMNQADPGVMNALMPIILEHEICGVKFKNFFVGAAGNFESENDAVSELSGPLKSRFKPLITWETGDEKSWKAAFGYIHKEWDKKLGKDFVQLFEDNAELFDNPREIEHKVLRFFEKIKNGEGMSRLKPEKILRRLKGLCKDELNRHEESQLSQLADDIYSNLKNNSGSGKKSRSSGKDINMVSDEVKDYVKKAIERGYVTDPNRNNKKYGISRENIFAVLQDEEMGLNAEMLQRLINKFEADQVTFKFETNKGWEKAGYADPEKDEDDDEKFGY